MKEEMLKVLNDESFTTNEARVDAQAKALATLVIPKDKFNEESAKRKKVEEENEILKSKLATLESNNQAVTSREDERVLTLEKELKNIKTESNRYKVESILKDAGLKEENITSYLETMDLSDEAKAVASANSVVALLNANTEKVKKETQASLLNQTPTPITGGTNASTATMDKLVQEYGEAIKSKDQVAQARLMRLIQEERAKTTSNINQ